MVSRSRRAIWILIVVGLIAHALAARKQADDQPEVAAALQRVRDKVEEISRNRSEREVLEQISAWKQREPQSPEPYVIAANYYLRKTMQPTGVNIYSTESGEPPAATGDQFSIVDPKTGKEVGVLTEGPSGPKPNVRTIRRYRSLAVDELERALKIAPNRLDIMLGRAMILNDAHDWPLLEKQLEIALQRIARDSKDLRWLENKPLPRAGADIALDALQSKIVDAFNEKSSKGDQRADRLAALGLKYFPNNVKLLSDRGTVRAFAKDWSAAKVFYERAASVAPNDSIVLGNLARAYMKLGDRQKAESTAKRVIKLNDDPEAVEQANEILRELAGQRSHA
jgi:tetratricopeptide (TPR) repeat protein